MADSPSILLTCKQWGLGPKAQEKKKMVKKGELDKYGKKIPGVTPQGWSKEYVDYKGDDAAVEGGVIPVS